VEKTCPTIDARRLLDYGQLITSNKDPNRVSYYKSLRNHYHNNPIPTN
jgi:hypothetical protein